MQTDGEFLSIRHSVGLAVYGRLIEQPAVVLAPMSGVTDLGFRQAAVRFGADLVVTEMVAADSFIASEEEARLRAERGSVRPHVVQVAGCAPGPLAEAARLAEAAGADAIDINMGCPAKRVVGGYAGSALMRDLTLATSLIRAVVAAVRVPVSVKMRLGWDQSDLNAPDLARRAAGEGAAAVTVHGRTRQQFYKGRADWPAIRAVREAITIPLIANGDCAGAADARAMLAASGANAVMVGRAAVGRPWLVGQIGAALRGDPFVPPSPEARRDAAVGHYESLLDRMGAQAGLRHARKHLAAYARAAAEDGYRVELDAHRRLVTSEQPVEVVGLLGGLWRSQPERIAA
jgi:tRNA-dihydrouridine synthase B